MEDVPPGEAVPSRAEENASVKVRVARYAGRPQRGRSASSSRVNVDGIFRFVCVGVGEAIHTGLVGPAGSFTGGAVFQG
jgi:hypothetical protein